MPADIIDLFRELGFNPAKKTAKEWASACPCCGGKDRCSIWPDEQEGRGYYWCRQCDVKGDGIQLLRDYAGMSYGDACKRVGVAPVANLKAPAIPKSKTVEPFQAVSGQLGQLDGVDRAKWQTHAAKLATWGTECLLRAPEHMAWLAARGLDADAVQRYRLGFNPGERGKNCIIRPRESWGLPSVRKDNGKPKKLWLPRGIIVPQITPGPDGVDLIERIRIRRLDADRQAFRPEHKYHVVEGSSMDLLWLPCTAQHDTGVVAVQETELDSYMLHAIAGDLTSCLASMTSNIRNMSTAVFERLQNAKCILVALDCDKAGAEGWPRWRATFPHARRWPVPMGKDAGEAFAAGLDLRLWVQAGMPEGLRLAMPAGQAPEMNSQEGARKSSTAPTAPDVEQPAPPPAVAESQPEVAAEQPAQKKRRPPRPETGISKQLSTAAGPLDSLAILRRVGVEAVPDGNDFRLTGHERWPLDDYCMLFAWLRRNGQWVKMALAGATMMEEQT